MSDYSGWPSLRPHKLCHFERPSRHFERPSCHFERSSRHFEHPSCHFERSEKSAFLVVSCRLSVNSHEVWSSCAPTFSHPARSRRITSRLCFYVDRVSSKEARPRNGKGKSRFLGIRLGMTIYLTHPSLVTGLCYRLIRDEDRALLAGTLIIRELLPPTSH